MPASKKSLTSIFLGFVGLLVAGYFGFIYFEANKNAPSNTTKAHNSSKNAVFYTEIGTSPSRASSLASPLNVNFTLELAIAEQEHEAKAKLENYEKQGVSAFYTPLQHKGRSFFRLRSGVFSTEAEARGAKKKLWEVARVKSDVGTL
ncbi:MAG: SPOR domain-containing protein [Oligoflexales bacterium]